MLGKVCEGRKGIVKHLKKLVVLPELSDIVDENEWLSLCEQSLATVPANL